MKLDATLSAVVTGGDAGAFGRGDTRLVGDDQLGDEVRGRGRGHSRRGSDCDGGCDHGGANDGDQRVGEPHASAGDACVPV